jgi:hypothetical protein
MSEDSFSVIARQSGAIDVAGCNETAERFGITISENGARLLAEAHNKTLKRLGRVEFAGGVIDKLITAFCDSPYLDSSNFLEAMEEFIEIFYEFKNDSLDGADDDEVIGLMKKYFDCECAGSIEALRDDMGREARRLRYGLAEDDEYGEDGDIYDE